MARACERWPKVGRYDEPAAWVYRVGLNWAASRLRRRRREVGGLAVDVEGPPVLPDPSVVAAIARLPVEQRAAVVMRYYLDWSIDQIADGLGVPAGTVKSRLSRALRSLAKELEDLR
ncbi:MAG: sigma factor-like helix-turn-helix DNA-binding protein [Acidimicrobiia bacterium]